jgi:hypothetical protein
MFYFNRFWEPVEDLLLGTANVFLQSLAYSLDFADEICIVDYKVSIYKLPRRMILLSDSD